MDYLGRAGGINVAFGSDSVGNSTSALSPLFPQ